MSYTHWNYDKDLGKFNIYFFKVANGISLNTSVSIPVDTLIKWYEESNERERRIILIKSIRQTFIMSEMTLMGNYTSLTIPLLPAKEIADEFLGQYEGLLNINAGP